MADRPLSALWRGAVYTLGPRKLAGAIALAIGCVLFTVELAEARTSMPASVVVELDGARIQESIAQVDIAAIVERYLDEPMELVALDDRWSVSRRELGVEVDRERLASWLRDREQLASLGPESENATPRLLSIPFDTTIETAIALDRLSSIATSVDRSAHDASYDVESRRVIAERIGHRLDRWASLEAIASALDAGRNEVTLSVVETHPERRAEQLADVNTDAVLGSFATHYSMLEEAADRTHNLRLIAEMIDGTVLLPGEELDFNRIVGERNRARGFRPAPVIAGGELIDGVGGGACQVAGTLHAAAFFAGLPIVERSPHSRPSAYIRLGLDAAVAFPKINFRFRNDRDYPVVVQVKLQGGQVRATLRGPKAQEVVSFVRRIESFTPFEERTVETSDLPAGVKVLGQRGVAGFKVSRWRIRRDMKRNQAVREAFEQDEYPPTDQIWRVGTGEPASEDYTAPEGDTHPEYTADDYLVVTQGAGLEEPQVSRRAGTTGAPGWTARAGMPGIEP